MCRHAESGTESEASVEFYYDLISPNAYLAWHALRDIARLHKRELILKPVLFAALLRAHDQVGPAEVAPKMQWMVRNCLRKANELGIALTPPHSHPFNPLLTLRLMLACPATDRARLTDILFRAVWAESRNVTDPDSMSDLLTANDFDADRMLKLADSDAIKGLLRTETESAVSRSVFGVPTIIVDGELFFGFDDLPWLERYLRGEDPIGKKEFAAWLTVQPSAWRFRR